MRNRNMYRLTGKPGFAMQGMGQGRGCRCLRLRRFFAPYRKIDEGWEKEALKRQAEMLHSELKLIEQRISDLESGGASE